MEYMEEGLEKVEERKRFMEIIKHPANQLLPKYFFKKVKCMIEYAPILIYIGVSLVLSLLILGLSFVFSTQKADPEKVSAYECGFDPFDDARSRFDIRFYLVAILFIIFDLEVTFLFPWAVSLSKIDFFGFWSMILFLAILTIGFIYEWKKGALEWE
jgi:NADH:ubiquinone oxidoreductase subunit 3 (subunit A)